MQTGTDVAIAETHIDVSIRSWQGLPRQEYQHVGQHSDNVFADLGLPDAGKLKIKTDLVIEIRKAMKSRGLTQQEAAKLMGITQSKVSDMMRGDLSNLSEHKLMDCLTRLGYDIEIKVRPAKAKVGHMMLAMA